MSTTDSNANGNAASVRSTISRKKLAANRRNARKSTGPRSAAGQRVSSYNAVTHGIFCDDLLIAGENELELSELRQWIHESLRIDGEDVIEIGYADAVLASRWKLRRVNGAERDLHGAKVHNFRRSVAENLGGLARWARDRYDRAYDDAEEASIAVELGQRRAHYESLRDGPDPAPGATLAADFMGTTDGLGTWERLSRYEQRLEQSIARSMRELRAYRKDLREFGRPESTDDDDDEVDAFEKAQNEPTAEKTAASDGAAEGCEASDRGLGVGPEPESDELSSGETHKPQNGEETRADRSREPSD